MTAEQIKAFWEGIAVANMGKIKMMDGGSGGSDIVNFDFDADYNATVTLSDGTVYNITGVEQDSSEKITKIYITDGTTEKEVECQYDSSGYLTFVGTVVVADVDKLDIQDAEINLQNKTVTPTHDEQTITKDTGYDGLGVVTVSGDENLIAENIVKNITIFGVTGSAEAGGDLRALDFLYTSKNNGFFNIAGWPSGYDTYWIRLNGNSADLICSNGLTWTFDGSYMRPNNTSTQVKWYKYSGNSSGWYFYQNDSGTWGCGTSGSKQLVWASVPIYYNGEIYLTPTYRPNVYIKE